MSIVGAFEVHRRQLTFEYLDTGSGELKQGQVIPADRQHLREWLAWPGSPSSTARWPRPRASSSCGRTPRWTPTSRT